MAARLDVKRLRELYSSNGTAKAAFDHFASRQYNSTRTTVDRLHQLLRQDDYDVARNQVVELLQGLAEIGCGKFVVGRRGHPSRFEWSVGLISVGRAAAGEGSAVEPISEADAKDDDDAIESIEHRFVLRPNSEVCLRLPVNLTTGEASRLSDWMKTLPMVS